MNNIVFISLLLLILLRFLALLLALLQAACRLAAVVHLDQEIVLLLVAGVLAD